MKQYRPEQAYKRRQTKGKIDTRIIRSADRSMKQYRPEQAYKRRQTGGKIDTRIINTTPVESHYG